MRAAKCQSHTHMCRAVLHYGSEPCAARCCFFVSSDAFGRFNVVLLVMMFLMQRSGSRRGRVALVWSQ